MVEPEEYIEESIPLTKPKRQVKQLATIPEEPVNTPQAPIQSAPVKKKRVMTKPKTQAQLQAFEKARQKRAENAAKRQQEKELHYAKLLAKHQEEQSVTKTDPEPKPAPRPVVKRAPRQKIIYDDSESDEEVIVVKRPSKRKPKKKTIVVESSESESESEDEQVSIQRQPATQRHVTFNSDDYFA